MKLPFARQHLASACALATALLITACGSPTARQAPPESAAQPAKQQFQTRLDADFSVDYQVERKASTVNRKSCFAFITGTLNNQSTQTLSRQSVLDVIVFNQGKQLFRDLTHPVSDVPPGTRVMFEMVESPVHRDGCPAYDRISISLRKVLAN
jgi:hypothetical protein